MHNMLSATFSVDYSLPRMTAERRAVGPDESTRLMDADCQDFLHSHLDHLEEHEHDHSHVPEMSWRLVFMIVLNGIVFVAELVTGFITGSLSLQSDAWHMLSDQAGLCIGLAAHRMSKRPPTPAMTFGYARAEALGGLVNATFLLAVCLMILFDAIERFANPPDIKQPLLFLVVGGIGMATNLIGLVLFQNHGHSDNIRGVFLHVFSDFLGSIAVIATALLYYFADWEPKKYADPLFSVMIVFMLVRGSVSLFKKTAMIAAERCPDSINSEDVIIELLKIDGVKAVHELHIWELSKGALLAMIHLVVTAQGSNRPVLEQVHNLLIGYRIYSSTVQIECADDFPEGVDQLGHCFYASSFGQANRVFVTPPVYRHVVGCPHLNLPGSPEDEGEHHGHAHDGHAHDGHGHSHKKKAGKRKQAEEELPLNVEEDAP
jgi:cation diffusion facilitator family transporter